MSLAVITGASSGIGAEFARQLAARGYDLLLVARRLDKLESVAAELATSTQIVTADLTDSDDLEQLVGKLQSNPVDLLVNNAGFGTKGRFFDTPLDGQMKMNQLHIVATVRITHAVLPSMVQRRSGAIINVSSVAAYARSEGNVCYNASKTWMNAFTEGLYLELRGVGSPVRVQALCPGYTHSEFHDTMGVTRSSVASSLWLQAKDVVAESLRGLDSADLFVIPDWRYRWFAALAGKLPVRLRLAMEARSPTRTSRT